jgi:flagellar hook-length control protein FliK
VPVLPFGAVLRGFGKEENKDDTEQGQPPVKPREKATEPSEKAERAPEPTREEPPQRTEQPSAPLAPRPAEVERSAAAAQRTAAATPEPPLQQLAAQMLRGVNIQQLGDQTSLRMELSTPKLSRVGLNLQVEAGRLTARFSVPDLAGRELIRSAAEQLEAGLGAKGIAVEAIQVEVEQSPRSSKKGAGRDGGRGGQEGGEGQGQRRQPKRHKKGFVL